MSAFSASHDATDASSVTSSGMNLATYIANYFISYVKEIDFLPDDITLLTIQVMFKKESSF